MFSKVDEGMKKGALEDIAVSAAGLITAAVGTSGLLKAGTKKTKQLTTQAAKTVTPGKTAQTAVASGRWTTGAVTVSGDADLIPANIREGVNIFGVNGTLKEGITGIDFGTVTLSSTSTYITVNHALGVIPSWVALIPCKLTGFAKGYSRCYANINGNVLYYDMGAGGTVEEASSSHEVTSSKITFGNTRFTSFYDTSYYWIAIA